MSCFRECIVEILIGKSSFVLGSKTIAQTVSLLEPCGFGQYSFEVEDCYLGTKSIISSISASSIEAAISDALVAHRLLGLCRARTGFRDSAHVL